MKQLTKSLEFSIDYNGQRLSYILGRLIVILALLIGLPIGFFMQDFSITTYIIIGGGVIASIVCDTLLFPCYTGFCSQLADVQPYEHPMVRVSGPARRRELMSGMSASDRLMVTHGKCCMSYISCAADRTCE